MSDLREPMLSAKDKAGFEHLLKHMRYPKLGSPKLDGIRGFVHNSVVYSRKLKPLPNEWLQEVFGSVKTHGLDGEMIVGKPFDPNVMQATDSGVMTIKGKPDLYFWVFDDIYFSGGFEKRLENAQRRVEHLVKNGFPRLRFVRHELLRNADEVRAYEEKALDAGYEGICLRDPKGMYKHGRSTLAQQWLIKVKRFEDFEAEVLEVHELMHNDNVATTNELGRTKRSGAKSGKRPGGTFGGATCRTKDGVVFRVGGGNELTAELRQVLWECRDGLTGKWLKLQKLPHGEKDKPRHPQFRADTFKLLVLGLRNEIDL